MVDLQLSYILPSAWQWPRDDIDRGELRTEVSAPFHIYSLVVIRRWDIYKISVFQVVYQKMETVCDLQGNFPAEGAIDQNTVIIITDGFVWWSRAST